MWVWRRTLASLSIFAGILTLLSMSWKPMTSVAVHAQTSSRGGHPHPVRRTVAEVRIEDSAFHSSAGLMDLEMSKATSVISRAISMSSTRASSVSVMCSSG